MITIYWETIWNMGPLGLAWLGWLMVAFLSRSSCMVWAQATSPQRSILCYHMVLGVLGPRTSSVLF